MQSPQIKQKGIANIYYDKDNRTVELEKLIGTTQKSGVLMSGDTIVMTSPVVLGDSFTQINEKWVYITLTVKAVVKILDMA